VGGEHTGNIHSLATLVAGLGLLFYGMDQLGASLRALASRRVQRLVGRATASVAKSTLVGLLIGGLTQSTSAVTFILVGLLASGLITMVAALPMVIGANLGVVFLLYVVTLEIDIVAMLLVGVTGFLLTLDRLEQSRAAVTALFGIALLLFGLILIHAGVTPLADSDWVQDTLVAYSESYLLSFLAGVVLAFVAQGSVPIAILAMALNADGLFGFEQAIVITYGANVGSTLTTLVLSAKLRGPALRIAMYQAGFNVVGALIMMPLFYLEVLGDVPLVNAFLAWSTENPELRIAHAFLVFNLAAAVFLLAVLGPSARLLERLFPEPTFQEAKRPCFLQDVALEDPDIALGLAEKEQKRLLEMAGGVFEAARASDAAEARLRATQAAEAFDAVWTATTEYLEDIGAHALRGATKERLYGVLDWQQPLAALKQAAVDLALDPSAGSGDASLDRFRSVIVEGVDGMRLALHEALSTGDAELVTMLERMTNDRGPAIARIRSELLQRDAEGGSAETRLGLYRLSALFERAVWQLRDLTGRLRARGAA